MSVKPWSHNLPIWGRYAVTLLSAILCGLIGTFSHRVGAVSNIPIGLIVALLLITLSAWCARSRTAMLGLLAHTVFSSAVAWILALRLIGTAVIVPVGFSGQLPWLSQHAGYIWLYGVILIQLIMLILPSRWFVIKPSVSLSAQSEKSAFDESVSDESSSDLKSSLK